MNAVRLMLLLVFTMSLTDCGSSPKPQALPASGTSAYFPDPFWRAPSAGTPLLWIADYRYLTAYSLSENGNMPPVDIVEGARTGIGGTATAAGPNGEVY